MPVDRAQKEGVTTWYRSSRCFSSTGEVLKDVCGKCIVRSINVYKLDDRYGMTRQLKVIEKDVTRRPLRDIFLE